jgi:hypothetical protein
VELAPVGEAPGERQDVLGAHHVLLLHDLARQIEADLGGAMDDVDRLAAVLEAIEERGVEAEVGLGDVGE